MHPPVSPLFPTVVLLSAGVIGLVGATFLGINPIVGFFALGAIVGPHALGLITDNSNTIHFLGELGVCFLLFDIGLHLSLKELRKGWRNFLVAGLLQYLLVTAFLSVVLSSLGISWWSAIVLSSILSLSSTALVLKLLSDWKEESSPVGKRATEVLVFQDIIAILLMVLLSGDLSQGVSLQAVVVPLGKMAAAAAAVVVIGKVALKPLFRLLIAVKSDEVITAFALLLVFATSWATESLGLSLALGAFLGGLALSESSYAYLVRGEIAPFRALLLSLFFLSVGINFDVPSLIDNAWLLVALLGIFIGLKSLGNFIALRIAGMERSPATRLALLLAQGSEFAFVLCAVAAKSGLIDTSAYSLSMSLVGVSLAVTPLLGIAGCVLSRSVCHVGTDHDATEHDQREVIIVTIDDFGRQLAGLLEMARIPYRAHDTDLERLTYAKSRGYNVYYSDLNRPRTLGRVSMGKALAVISLIEDDALLTHLIGELRKIDGALPVVAATESPQRMELLAALNIEHIFVKREGSLIAVFESLLRVLGYDADRIEDAVRRALDRLSPEGVFPTLSDPTAPPEALAA